MEEERSTDTIYLSSIYAHGSVLLGCCMKVGDIEVVIDKEEVTKSRSEVTRSRYFLLVTTILL